jgi:hypothetical protein
MTTEATVLTDLLDAIVCRLSDIAAELRSNLSDPALAEVRAAAKAVERAFVLLSPWDSDTDDIDSAIVMKAVEEHILRDGIPMPPEHHFDCANIEASSVAGDEFLRVTMPGCVYLVTDSFDDGDGSTEIHWSVVGRYPQ